MASETTNLHLVKPDPTEAVDVEPLNENCDKIDDAYAALAAEISNKVDKIAGKGLSTNDYTNADKTALIELVDGGAKNMANPLAACGYLTQGSTYPITIGGVTFTLGADGTITNSGSSTSTRALRIPVTLPAGTYHFGGTPSGGGTSSGRIDIREPGTDTFITTTTDTGEGFFYTFDATTSLDLCIRIAANYAESMTFKPMICSATDYAISPKFVPYAKSNAELTEDKVDKVSGKGLSTNDFTNAYKTKVDNIHALETNITSSTTIKAYVDALSKGHYVTLYTNSSKPSDAPAADNCFVEIFVYSSSTAYVRVTPTGTMFFGSTYELNKVSGTWETQWVANGYGALVPDNTDINTLKTIGDYFIGTTSSAETMTNLPTGAKWSGHIKVECLNAVNKTRIMQTYIPAWNAADRVGKIFIRHLINTNEWTSWYKFEGAAVT